jgi:hypothetical protein
VSSANAEIPKLGVRIKPATTACSGRLGLCAFLGDCSEHWQLSVSEPVFPQPPVTRAVGPLELTHIDGKCNGFAEQRIYYRRHKMQVDWRASTWNQFGAAIDMLGDVINLCPDHLWTIVVYTDPDDERYSAVLVYCLPHPALARPISDWHHGRFYATIPFYPWDVARATLHKGSDPWIFGRLPREVPIDDRSANRRKSATTLRI